jgi:hypothetical protein
VLVAASPFDPAGDREVVEAVEHGTDDHRDLLAGERRAEAVVQPVPEREMRVGVAVEVESERVGEHGVVAVRGGIPVGGLVPGGDAVPRQLDVPGGRAAVVRRGARPAQDLLDGAREERPVAPQPGQLVRVLDEREQTAGDGVAGGPLPAVNNRLKKAWSSSSDKAPLPSSPSACTTCENRSPVGSARRAAIISSP